MTVFAFFSYVLVIIVLITMLWPLNVPLMALAYKIRLGTERIPLTPQAFWLRAAFAALSLTLLSLVMVLINLFLVKVARLPTGPVHIMLLVGYVPAGVWLTFWLFAMEDLLQGLSVFLLYLFLPGVPLAAITWLFSWQLLPNLAQWLRLTPT